MKPWATLVTVCLFPSAQSFPTLTSSNVASLAPEDLKQALEIVKLYRKEKRFIIDLSKPIDISGKHAFKAPGKGDQRGPCPGLNVLANHGYISHNGITSYAEVVTAINQGSYRDVSKAAQWCLRRYPVFGMGIDLALILGVMGTVWTGNPLSLDPGFSIGGTAAGDGSDNVLDNLVGVLGATRMFLGYRPY